MAPSIVVALVRWVASIIRMAAATIGKVSKKLACARSIRPTSGLGGGSSSSRAPMFHLVPYCFVLTCAAAKMWISASRQPHASILSSMLIIWSPCSGAGVAGGVVGVKEGMLSKREASR